MLLYGALAVGCSLVALYADSIQDIGLLPYAASVLFVTMLCCIVLINEVVTHNAALSSYSQLRSAIQQGSISTVGAMMSFEVFEEKHWSIIW